MISTCFESQSIINQDKIAALLLAGGQGRRMGQPKALLQIFNAQTQCALTMAEHHIVAFNDWGLSVLLAAGQFLSQLKLDSSLQWQAVDDALETGQGPLSALLGGLNKAKQSAQPFLWVWSCDSLLTITDLKEPMQQMQRIIQGADLDCIYIKCQNKDYPLLAIYKSKLAGSLAAYLLSGERRVMEFLSQIKSTPFEIDVSFANQLNLNTLEQLRQYPHLQIPQISN